MIAPDSLVVSVISRMANDVKFINIPGRGGREISTFGIVSNVGESEGHCCVTFKLL